MAHQQSKMIARSKQRAVGFEAETAVGDQRLLEHRGDREEPDRRKDQRRCNKDQAFGHDPRLDPALQEGLDRLELGGNLSVIHLRRLQLVDGPQLGRAFDAGMERDLCGVGAG